MDYYKGCDRVTEVLSYFSGLDKVPEHILRNACERGNKVHQCCDSIIEGLEDASIDEELKTYIKSFKLWKQDKVFCKKPERFFCFDLEITGECDALYYEKDKLILVDFKTSFSEGKTWRLQGSAYSYLARVNSIKVDEIHFVHLCKKGTYPEVYCYLEDFDLFKSCLDVYRYFYKKKNKND